MSKCYNKLTSDIALNCKVNLVSGIGDKVWLINRDDIDFESCTYNTLNNNIIESIVLNSASPTLRGYYAEGFRNSNEYENTLVKGKYQNGWEQKLTIRVFDNTADTKEQVNEIANGKFVCVIENNYKSEDGTSAFEVLGWSVGLEVAEAMRNPSDADMKGGWTLVLQTDEDNKERYPAKTFFNTDIATSRTALDALVA
jgi:hypothetical protein